LITIKKLPHHQNMITSSMRRVVAVEKLIC